MNQYQVPLTNIKFVLYEVFKVQDTWLKWTTLDQLFDQDTANTVLSEGAKLSEQILSPIFQIGDQEGCYFANGKVATPKTFKEAYNTYIQGGWLSLCGNPEYGGLDMPKSIGAQFDEMSCSANLAFTLYPSLTAGAALAIDAHASDEIKTQYLKDMYLGHVSGTMCLTESNAGSDLSLINTKAIEQQDNSYKIFGTKIFITGGEHDLCDNIIHLVLARIPDSPEGTKGVSMFLVPKFIAQDGIKIKNKVYCSSLEKKMGIKSSATCMMNFDGAQGVLIGKPNEGLPIMFTMMNYERLLVGIQGLACSERSYQNALAYAKERLQGKSISRKTSNKADPIFFHGDIRKTLMKMKAMNEAGRAFSTYVAHCLDICKFSNDEQEKHECEELIALLTPVVKAFLTDTGLQLCIDGQQVLGGHGYIQEWEQEQLVRDVRITQIYEGTNGIQALDLLSRKIVADSGKRFNIFCKKIELFIKNNPDSEFSSQLQNVLIKLIYTTKIIIVRSKKDVDLVNTACSDYLKGFGYVVYGWMWALMAEAAKENLLAQPEKIDFYQSKITIAQFYFQRILPHCYTFFNISIAPTNHLFSIKDDQW